MLFYIYFLSHICYILDFGLSFYYLPMDEIKNNIVQNPSGLDATVYLILIMNVRFFKTGF
jgi:hypothetical protein